jgi:GxxExxY protein
MNRQSTNAKNKVKLLHPELSYKIVGCAFDVQNNIGGNQSEKTYQEAMATALTEKEISFKREVYCPVTYKGKVVGKNFIDFVVENKIAVEIKRTGRYSSQYIKQLFRYLDASEIDLIILIHFHDDKVRFERIVKSQS